MPNSAQKNTPSPPSRPATGRGIPASRRQPRARSTGPPEKPPTKTGKSGRARRSSKESAMPCSSLSPSERRLNSQFEVQLLQIPDPVLSRQGFRRSLRPNLSPVDQNHPVGQL